MENVYYNYNANFIFINKYSFNNERSYKFYLKIFALIISKLNFKILNFLKELLINLFNSITKCEKYFIF